MTRSLPPIRSTLTPRVADLVGGSAFAVERGRLEALFAHAYQAAEARLVPTGRSGMRLLLHALAAPGRGRVILPAYADTSLPETVLSLGLQPVPCDVRASDGTLDPVALDRLLGRDVLAVVALHLFGHPSDLKAITARAAPLGVAVIEDCAHRPMPPVASREHVAGGFTSLGAFKMVDCGGGGVVWATDPACAERMRTAAGDGHVITAGTAASRLLGAAAMQVITAPLVYGPVGHRLFSSVAEDRGVLAFYKRYVRPVLKSGVDAEDGGLPSTALIRSGLRQVAQLPSRIAERQRLAARLREGAPPGLWLTPSDAAASSESSQVALFRDRSAAIARLVGEGVGALPALMGYWPEQKDAETVAARLDREAVQIPWYDGLREKDVDLLRAAVLRAAEQDRAAVTA